MDGSEVVEEGGGGCDDSAVVEVPFVDEDDGVVCEKKSVSLTFLRGCSFGDEGVEEED